MHACDRRTDGRTDGETDRITTSKTALAYACAVKTNLDKFTILSESTAGKPLTVD